MNNNHKKGFTLVELATVMAITGTLMTVQLDAERQQSSQELGRSVGKEIYAYQSGVSRMLASNISSPSAVTGTHYGSTWLKDSSCGGTASEGFLACTDLPNGSTISGHIEPVTTVTLDGNGELSSRTVWDPVLDHYGKEDASASGVAALAATGSYLSKYKDPSNGYQAPTVYCPEISSYASSIAAQCGADKGKIISLTAVNAGIDEWLRVDHTNTMKSVLEFDDGTGQTTPFTGAGDSIDDVDDSFRQIVNVSRIYNKGATGDDSIVIGRDQGKAIFSDALISGNGLLQGAVIMDANTVAMEKFYAKGESYFNDAVEIASTLDVQGNTRVRSDFRVDGDSEVRGDAVFAGDVDLTSGNLAVNGDADISSDLDVGGSADINGRLDVAGNAKVNGSVGGAYFYDVSDSSYRIDPRGNSKLRALSIDNDLNVGRVILKNSYSEGASCSPNGSLGKTSAGMVITCEKGKWGSLAGGGLKGLMKQLGTQTITCWVNGTLFGGRILTDGTPQIKVGSSSWSTNSYVNTISTNNNSGYSLSLTATGIMAKKYWKTERHGGHADGKASYHSGQCSKFWKMN